MENCPKCNIALVQKPNTKAILVLVIGVILMPVLIGIPIVFYGMKLLGKKSLPTCAQCGFEDNDETKYRDLNAEKAQSGEDGIKMK